MIGDVKNQTRREYRQSTAGMVSRARTAIRRALRAGVMIEEILEDLDLDKRRGSRIVGEGGRWVRRG